jgi:hypothetical protein
MRRKLRDREPGNWRNEGLLWQPSYLAGTRGRQHPDGLVARSVLELTVPALVIDRIFSMTKQQEIQIPDSHLNKAAPNEPLFILMGRDPAAPIAIRAWIFHRVQLGKNHRNDPQRVEALELAKRMDAYRDVISKRHDDPNF